MAARRTATHAGPPTVKTDAAKPVAPDYPKWSSSANFGRIGQLYPHGADGGGVYFRLMDGQTTMEPRSGYYSLKTHHPNYQAMCDLLYRAAEKRWKIYTWTREELDRNGFAVVQTLVVNFPADAPSPRVAGGALTASPHVGWGEPEAGNGQLCITLRASPYSQEVSRDLGPSYYFQETFRCTAADSLVPARFGNLQRCEHAGNLLPVAHAECQQGRL